MTNDAAVSPDAPPDLRNFRLQFDQLVLTLGYRCNMFCSSCFIGERLHDHETELTYEDCVEAIESAARLKTIGSVAFVGGEPFVYYKLMLRVAAYVHRHYQCPLNVTTNASWGKSPEMVQRLLDPLHALGLRWMLVSLDEYHLEFGTIRQAALCLDRAVGLGIDTSVQVILRKGGPRAADFREELASEIDVDAIKWIENPCSAIGNAETLLEPEDLTWHARVPVGGCNAGEILNVQPDGEVKPCCGAGLMSDRLSLCNAKTESIYKGVQKAEVDPLLNSLIAHQGPRELEAMLIEAGREDLVERHAPFTDACHACHSFLNDEETLQVIEDQLAGRVEEMLINRVLALRSAEIMQHVSQAPSTHA